MHFLLKKHLTAFSAFSNLGVGINPILFFKSFSIRFKKSSESFIFNFGVGVMDNDIFSSLCLNW